MDKETLRRWLPEGLRPEDFWASEVACGRFTYKDSVYGFELQISLRRILGGNAIESGSSDKPVASVTDRYSPETGALTEQTSTNEAGEHETLSRAYNTLGQTTSYTDANGNETTYSYDGFGRLSEVNDDATGLDGLDATSKYAYSEETGRLSQLEASGVGAFKASYDLEGQLTKETYPNGMSASYADGITYVPQIGRALQTTSVSPPLPENKAVAYVSTVEQGVFAGAAAEAEHETASFQEALRKAEEAGGLRTMYLQPTRGQSATNRPKPATTIPKRAITHTAVKSRQHGELPKIFIYKINWHYGSTLLVKIRSMVLNYRLVYSGFLSGNTIDGTYRVEGFEKFTYHDTSGKSKEITIKCTSGDTYRAWVWGRYWYKDKETVWSALAINMYSKVCPEVNVY